MYKRILRTISAVLALAMLAEMFPTILLGNLVQRAAAVTPLEVLEGISPTAPAETPSKWEIEIPPTLVEGPEVVYDSDLEDDSYGSADSVQASEAESDVDLLSAPYYYQCESRVERPCRAGCLQPAAGWQLVPRS